jgi:serine/threonine-protein kinase
LPGHLQILISVCNALHFAHSREVVHRDIKPANVLIGRFGDVYVADWGVATRIDGKRSQLCGTPAYMAPEMVSGDPVDARTDVYLLGSTLHAVLTGKPRHPGATVTESLLHAKTSPAFEYASEVPEELAALANRACHADPSQRPPTAKAFRDELTVYLRHRDARALAATAIKRVTELESLHAIAEPDEEQRRKLERLLLEARFGLEQALAQWPENGAAKSALEKVEKIIEQRQQRAIELEREAKERNPQTGAAYRTVGLGALAVIATVTAVVASFFPAQTPTPLQMVAFPGFSLAAIIIGTFFMRKNLLDTRFNREVFACVLVTMGFIFFGRVIGLFVEIPMHMHFMRDSMLTAGVMTVCAYSMLRWTGVIAALYLVTTVCCAFFPPLSMWLFSGTTIITMFISTFLSWWLNRQAKAEA